MSYTSFPISRRDLRCLATLTASASIPAICLAKFDRVMATFQHKLDNVEPSRSCNRIWITIALLVHDIYLYKCTCLPIYDIMNDICQAPINPTDYRTHVWLWIYTLLAKKVVIPPLKTIKPMWIELLCFHLAEIGMIWTRDCSPTKSDTTLGRHSMQGQVGSSSAETTV